MLDNSKTVANEREQPDVLEAASVVSTSVPQHAWVPSWTLAALIGGLVAFIGFTIPSLLLGTPRELLWWGFFVGDILGGCLTGAVASRIITWRQSSKG